MVVAKAELLGEIEVAGPERSAEGAWLKSNQLAERREILREHAPIVDLSFGTLGREVAYLLGRDIISPKKIDFSNKEFVPRFPRVEPMPRSVYIVGSFPYSAIDIRALYFAGEFFKRKGVEQVTGVCAGFPFSRQDGIFTTENGEEIQESISLKVEMANLANWINRLIVVDPHSKETVDYGLEYKLPVLAVSAWKYLADHVKPFLAGEDIVVAGPDFGRAAIARKLADYFGCRGIIFNKWRDPITNKLHFDPLTAEQEKLVAGKVMLTFDEVITTGETIGGIADLSDSLENPPEGMVVLATQGEFVKEAAANLDKSLIEKILVTDARPPLVKPDLPSLETVPIAPFLAQIIGADSRREDGKYINPWQAREFEGIIIG